MLTRTLLLNKAVRPIFSALKFWCKKMSERLTIQIYVEGQWHDAMMLTINNPRRTADGVCSAAYMQSYLVAFIDRVESVFEHAVSVNLPVSWTAVRETGYPAFIYDLAPMVLDPEGVTRVTKWKNEQLGAPDWAAVCASYQAFLDPYHLMRRLKGAAQQFRALPELLTELPEDVLRAQSIPLNKLDTRLGEWGLL